MYTTEHILQRCRKVYTAGDILYSRGVERPINVIYSRGVGKCMHRNNNTYMQGDVKTHEYVRTYHYISSD